ncbi:Guanosine-5'-triphosphate,3'-diphosphate pyrophosphatase [Campylobacter majalis]|uniref:Guanosine-5'-triphosphate,3'-diphosphate pyrophosphatase n=1 Tax=Campylobacter majalis TaxID=2790656 RepID=A0ABN7K666_9BACT|nr:Ppx/GppA phosphatase family protein [Campylobacter majalis]CAD7287610.1 Guanosine-5'-triphosphate,3'-diphosphate pyrophosphatase [Campylobacter majalis]
MAKRTAVIDIGSNSIRMAIFERTSRWAFFTLSDHKARVRLAEGGYDSDGAISSKAYDAAFGVLSEFKQIAKAQKCTKIFAVGTSALRDAPNTKNFICDVKNKLGIGLKVIDGESEARYGAVAANLLLKLPSHAVTLDIGGGSSELAVIKDGAIQKAITLNIGTVRLKELFGERKNDNKINKFIKQILKQLPDDFKCENLIAIGGSLRAVSSAIIKRLNYAFSVLHGFNYDLKEQLEFLENLLQTDNDKLDKFFIKKDRFDTIKEGVLIFLAIAKALEVKRVITSGVGVREGVFLSDFLRPGLKFPAGLNPSVKSIQDRFGGADTKNIQKNAKAIFNVLSPLHAIDEKFIYELDMAAKLCCIGRDIGFYNDHINSAFIVQNSLNYGFTHEQKALILAIIATNGKKVVYEYDRYKSLLPKRSDVRWLSFILYLAKALDVVRHGVKFGFKFENNILHISGIKSLILAKEEIKKLTKPNGFIISFE